MFAGTLTLAAGAGLAETQDAGERLQMSHRCVVDKGRLLVMSVRDVQEYAILGARSETPVSFCRVGTDCRHFATQSFAVACDGGVVPWVEIAAALSHQRLGRATVENGRLLLRPYEGPPTPPDPTKRKVSATLTFPEGHAPVKELGASVIQPTVSAPTVRPADRAADVQVTLTAAATEPPLPWLTVVERQNPPMIPRWLRFCLLAGGIAAVFAAAWFVVRRRHGLLASATRPWSWRRRTGWPLAGSAEAQACHDLLTLAEALIGKLQATIGGLGAAQPLRQALARELRRHRDRLGQLSVAATAETPDWRRLRGRLEGLNTELARLQDIADGAVKSVDRTISTVTATPVDRQSAFEVLGVAPDASERVVKKLVEALRASWHPDLARDETDRRQREARLKDINVAWDLISGKRQEA